MFSNHIFRAKYAEIWQGKNIVESSVCFCVKFHQNVNMFWGLWLLFWLAALVLATCCLLLLLVTLVFVACCFVACYLLLSLATSVFVAISSSPFFKNINCPPPFAPCYCFVACFVAWVIVGTSTHDMGVQVVQCGTFEPTSSIFLVTIF
jgi:hypothetical protein